MLPNSKTHLGGLGLAIIAMPKLQCSLEGVIAGTRFFEVHLVTDSILCERRLRKSADWNIFDFIVIGSAMMTLFILLTLENFPTYLDQAQVVSPFASVFFLSYVLIAAFVVLNLVLGIVVGSMEEAREEEQARLREQLGLVEAEIGELARKKSTNE